MANDPAEEDIQVATIRDFERRDCVLEIREYANAHMTTMDRARYDGMMAAAEIIDRRILPPNHPRAEAQSAVGDSQP